MLGRQLEISGSSPITGQNHDREKTYTSGCTSRITDGLLGTFDDLPGAGMNTKRKGNRNEHRSMRLLEAAGYSVTRAAASLGVWDIIGIGSTDIVLVQVKTRDWPGSVEMEVLRNFVAAPHCRKLVHRWRDHQRNPDVKEL